MYFPKTILITLDLRVWSKAHHSYRLFQVPHRCPFPCAMGSAVFTDERCDGRISQRAQTHHVCEGKSTLPLPLPLTAILEIISPITVMLNLCKLWVYVIVTYSFCIISRIGFRKESNGSKLHQMLPINVHTWLLKPTELCFEYDYFFSHYKVTIYITIIFIDIWPVCRKTKDSTLWMNL